MDFKRRGLVHVGQKRRGEGMNVKELNDFKTELKALLEKYEVEIGAEVTDERYGVEHDFVLFDKDNKMHILAEHVNFIDKNDL